MHSPLSREVRLKGGHAGRRENQSAGAGPSVFLDDLQHKLSYEERVHLTAREYLERGLMEQVPCSALLFETFLKLLANS